MKYVAVYLLSLFLFLFTFELSKAATNLEYFGADHNEAEFSIIGYVTINQAAAPTKDQIDLNIRKQMRYMLGLMRSRSEVAAALYPKWTIAPIETKKLGPNSYSVKYYLKTKGVFAAGVNQYTFTIPYNPQTIFTDSQSKCMKEVAGESNFWYHWEPRIAGCPLVESTHYYTYTTSLSPVANTRETYPEYKKLVDANNDINVTLFFGFENYGFTKWTPDGGEDWGIRGFNYHLDFLRSQGFQESLWTLQQVEQIYKAKDGLVPYVVEMTYKGTRANLRIRMVLADTGYNHNSLAFHTFLKESFLKESVVIYNGHSGIGKNFDLGAIEKYRGFKYVMNPNYQIIFLGSCVPYAYYTDMLFERKKTADDINGTLKLDILSFGKESVFANQEDRALISALLKFATQSKKTSYQDMIRSSPNYFFGISGDEDNPITK